MKRMLRRTTIRPHSYYYCFSGLSHRGTCKDRASRGKGRGRERRRASWCCCDDADKLHSGGGSQLEPFSSLAAALLRPNLGRKSRRRRPPPKDIESKGRSLAGQPASQRVLARQITPPTPAYYRQHHQVIRVWAGSGGGGGGSVARHSLIYFIQRVCCCCYRYRHDVIMSTLL